ncbi:DUF4197 domain-containing protein [Rhodoferax sp.]|uniref:DUF4197 domain-containing protein n=1 Tax=Rhodoferax sp. TaxID=50421 RepID=UPI00271C9A66|nr:DUF4197 domain-containing protein [Rhodoferax sp.]MDO8319102.1 DUF4197 domain-containing protein [Rhodoferax sp.]MDP2680568.1 DUF4197 domain-containing protein [Rhodoferax sp.]
MNRRRFSTLSGVLAAASCLGVTVKAHALSLNDVSNAQALQGLKLALEKGALAAVKSLGQANGFLGNDKVRIPLPGVLDDAARLLRNLGQGAPLDELIAAMNHAAEMAVPMARDMLVGVVKTMKVQDAKKILTGGDNSVTQFFAEKTRQDLSRKFLPLVTKVTSRVKLADKYNQIAAKTAGIGLLKGDQVSIEQYVTAKSLDGLYLMIGEEEKKIRQDPVGTGSAVLQKVFGALRP